MSGDTLLVFLYYLVASDIWPYKRGTTLLCVFGEKQNFRTNIHVYIYCICKDCVQSVHILIVYSVLLCKMSCRHFYDKYIKLHNIIFIIKNMVPLQLFYLILILSPSLSYEVVWFMVFNATFNNISVISLPSVLLLEETEYLGFFHRYSVSSTN